MVLSKRVGVTLREAREERKLSIKDVARETNIAAKYVEALEAEDFNQFPGETYAMGFLRNYVEFLNMDVEHILNLYRGQKIDQSPAPVKELTRESGSISINWPTLNLGSIDSKWFYSLGIVLLVSGIVILFASGTIELPDFSSSISNSSASKSPCEGREIEDFSLPAVQSGARGVFLDDKSSLRFTADQHRIKLCLLKVVRNPQEGSFAHLSMLIDDEQVYNFEIKEQEDYTISSQIKGLKGLGRRIIIQPVALGEYTAQMEFVTQAGEPGNLITQDNTTPETQTNTTETTKPQNQVSGTGVIQVTLEFLQPSYLSWTSDGQRHPGKTWLKGRTVTLEANNRLEIKIGNGGGVRIRRDGVAPRLAGRPAQIVTLTYSMVPDPLDPAIRQIKETIR